MNRVLLLLLVPSACGVGALPVDEASTASLRWSQVLVEPRDHPAPAFTPYVRGSLAFETRTRRADASRAKHWIETRIVLGDLLPMILERGDDADLRRLASFLRRRQINGPLSIADVLGELWSHVDRLIRDQVSGRAYETVLYGAHDRTPSRRELAFIALETSAYWLESLVGDTPKRRTSEPDRPETASLGPEVLPYLAVAVGADPREVRLRVRAVLDGLAR